METTYEGWKNRQTWNCALWIGNDYELYTAACNFMRSYTGRQPYRQFILSMGMSTERTGDNIKWLGQQVCFSELNQMMKELIEA